MTNSAEGTEASWVQAKGNLITLLSLSLPRVVWDLRVILKGSKEGTIWELKIELSQSSQEYGREERLYSINSILKNNQQQEIGTIADQQIYGQTMQIPSFKDGSILHGDQI